MAADADAPPPGVSTYYQGYQCGVAFSMERPTGVEPGFGFVHIERQVFKKLEIKESFVGVDSITASKGSAEGFMSMGTLLFQETDLAGNTVTTKLEKILITESGIEISTKADDPDGGVARIQLADIRYLWGRRGRLPDLWINMLREGDGQGDADAAKAAADFALSAAGSAAAYLDTLKKLKDAIFGTPGDAPGAFASVVALLKKDPLAFGPLSAGFFAALELAITPGELGGDAAVAAALKVLDDGIADAAKAAGPDSVAAALKDVAKNHFLPGSLDGEVPWTLRRLLVIYVLPNLPGAPTLRRLPPDLEKDDARRPLNHTWVGVLAKQALEDLLAEFRLVLCLNPDASVSLYHEGEGGLAQDAYSTEGFPIPEGDAEWPTNPAIASVKKLVTNHYIPAVFIVQGPPIHMTAVAQLEPVGELNGRIMPLKAALAGIGVSFENARRLPFLKEPQALALGVSYQGVEEFRRWGFKMYAIPGLAKACMAAPGATPPLDAFGVLPILDRGLVDSIGQTLAPRVRSERAVPAALAELKKIGPLKAHVTKKLEELIDSDSAKVIETDRADAEKYTKIIAGLPKTPPEEPTTTSDAAEAKKVSIKFVWTHKELDAAGAKSVELAAEEAKKNRLAAFERALKKLKEIGGYIAMVNLDFALQSSGYTIDRERGVVTFNAVQGHVEPEGGAPEISQMQEPDAKVWLEFGYTRKATPDIQLQNDDRYSSVWQRNPDGTAKQLMAKPSSVQADYLDRPDFLQVVDIHGNSNKAKLDERAAKLALERFARKGSTVGAEFAFCRPVQLINTGRVLSIHWQTTSDGRPAVVARVEAEAPIPPRPDFSTFARPRQGDAKMHSSLLGPRSTRK